MTRKLPAGMHVRSTEQWARCATFSDVSISPLRAAHAQQGPQEWALQLQVWLQAWLPPGQQVWLHAWRVWHEVWQQVWQGAPAPVARVKYNFPVAETSAKPHTPRAPFANTISVSDALSLYSSTPLGRPLSTDISDDTSESVAVCEAWDASPDPDPEEPVQSRSLSNELARDGEGGLEGGSDDPESKESAV